MTVASPLAGFHKMLRAMLADESAQGLVEYAIVIALVAMVSLAAIRALGGRAKNSLGSAANGFS